MKTETASSTIQGSLSGKSITMGVRDEDMGNIMAIMTDIYSDRLKALPREYACNAIDAHREAGVDLPVEIFLPSRFAPALRIRDYGVGMDADTIEQVYAQYGRSTKRDSNEQIGGFGIGCKSALSYTDQFTVTSIKDGFKVVVLVSRDEDSRGRMEIMNMPPDAEPDWRGEETQEGNGTEVSIAINATDMYRVADVVQEFFQFWDKGTVLVDGQTPKHFTANSGTRKLSDTLYLVEGSQSARDVIVMGGVSYPPVTPIARPNAHYGAPSFSIVAFVPIGACAPHPSREQLRDTSKTKQTIKDVQDNLKVGLHKIMETEIGKAATHAEALKAMLVWRRYDPSAVGALKYKGDKLPIPWEPTVKSADVNAYSSAYVPVVKLNRGVYGRQNSYENTRIIDPEMWPNIVWVTGYEPQKFTGSHREKLIHWAKTNEIGYKKSVSDAGEVNYISDGSMDRFVLLRGKDKPDSPFINPKRFVSWDTIKAVKISRPSTGKRSAGGGRITGSFDILTESGYQHQVLASSIDPKRAPLLYVVGNRWEAERWNASLAAVADKHTLVFMGSNRRDKFKRDFPTAKSVAIFLEEEIKLWVAKQDKLDLQARQMMVDGSKHLYVNLTRTRVDDPAIKEAIDIAKRDVASFYDKTRDLARKFTGLEKLLQVKVDNPLKHYPLYRSGGDTRHNYFYLNAAYAARKAGKL